MENRTKVIGWCRELTVDMTNRGHERADSYHSAVRRPIFLICQLMSRLAPTYINIKRSGRHRLGEWAIEMFLRQACCKKNALEATSASSCSGVFCFIERQCDYFDKFDKFLIQKFWFFLITVELAFNERLSFFAIIRENYFILFYFCTSLCSRYTKQKLVTQSMAHLFSRTPGTVGSRNWPR